MAEGLHLDGHAFHDDWIDRLIVTIGLGAGDLHRDFHALSNLAEDRMLGVTRGKPIQEVVVDCVEEELGTSGVRSTGVGHRKGTRFVRDLGGKLVLDAPLTVVTTAGFSRF